MYSILFASGGKITVAADWSCLLQAINRPDSKDSVVEYTSPQLLTRSVDVQELKLDKDFYRLSCVPNKHLVGTESQKVENEPAIYQYCFIFASLFMRHKHTTLLLVYLNLGQL